MKIFFTSCITKRSPEQANRIELITQLLRESGNKVDSYIYDQDDGEENGNTFQRLAQLVQQSDVYIAEMSVASQTLGFQIAYALNSTKPCLYLYHTSTKGRPGVPLVGNPSRLLKIVAYNEADVRDRLGAFLEYAQKQLATARTSFMSTQEIDSFLNERSKRLGVHKAELIRQILHDAIEKQ